MKDIFGTAITCAAGFTISNFIWQALTSQEWGVAVEQSWFQFVAIAVLAGLLARHSPITK